MATTARRARSRRGEGQHLRGEILEVAERLLVEAGDARAVSIRAIADAIGCTPPAIYLHFADKDQLFSEICARRFEEFGRAVRSVGDATEDPLETLKERGKTYIRFGLEHPQHYKLLMMAPRTERGQDAPGMGVFQHLVDSAQRCIDGGSISDEHSATQIALLVWFACHGITALFITFPNIAESGDVNDLIELLLDVQLEGLLAI